MKLYVEAEAKFLKVKYQPRNYILDYRKFNIDCEICNECLGVLQNKYKLCLDGTEENIKSYISYLRMEGFKVRIF